MTEPAQLRKELQGLKGSRLSRAKEPINVKL